MTNTTEYLERQSGRFIASISHNHDNNRGDYWTVSLAERIGNDGIYEQYVEIDYTEHYDKFDAEQTAEDRLDELELGDDWTD